MLVPLTRATFRGEPLVWSPHQRRCLERVRSEDAPRALLLALAPGAGKTLVLLASAALLRAASPRGFRAVFVVPAGLFAVWEEHVREFWAAGDWRAVFLRTRAEAEAAAEGRWDAAFVSPHLLARLFTSAFRFGRTRAPDGSEACGWAPRAGAAPGAALRALRAPQLLAVDEAHHFRRPAAEAAQAAALRYVGARAGRILAATGTPVVADERDACATLRNLGASEVALDACGAGGRVSGAGARGFVGRFVERVTAAELAAQLPPLTVRVEPLTGARPQAEYNALVHRAKQLARFGLRGPELAAAYQRMLLLCAEAKAPWVEARVRTALGAHRKVVLCSPTVRPLEAFAERLADAGPLLYTGEQSASRRAAVLEAFRGDPRKRVLLLSQRAGGEGLTLCEASCVVFACAGFHPSEDAQVQARIWRRGQARACEAVYLPIEHSLEHAMLRLQADKRALEGAVLDGARAGGGRWKAGGSLASQLREIPSVG